MIQLCSVLLASALSVWIVVKLQQSHEEQSNEEQSQEEQVGPRLANWQRIAVVIIGLVFLGTSVPSHWWATTLFFTGVLVQYLAPGFRLIRLTIDSKREEQLAPTLLADIQIQVQSGASPLQALKRAGVGNTVLANFAKKIERKIERNESPETSAVSRASIVDTLADEIGHVIRTPHLAQGQIEFLRERHTRLLKFRRRSRQAQFQPHFQSIVLTILFLAVLLWSSFSGQIDGVNAFVASVLMMGGLLWMRRLARLPVLRV